MLHAVFGEDSVDGAVGDVQFVEEGEEVGVGEEVEFVFFEDDLLRGDFGQGDGRAGDGEAGVEESGGWLGLSDGADDAVKARPGL